MVSLMNKKSLLAILFIVAMVMPIVAMAVPASAFVPGFNSVPGDTDFVVLKGTLNSDRYSPWQYSYKMYRWAGESPVEAFEECKEYLFQEVWKSLRLGLTEYGEFVVVNDSIRAGLAYGADDAEMDTSESIASWAAGDAKNLFSGWVLYIKYVRAFAPSETNNTREILAWAVSGDGISAGAGRKVLGKWAFWYDSFSGVYVPTWWSDDYAVQEGSMEANGIKVLYESARLAVVRTNVTIYDHVDLDGDDVDDEIDPVASVIFTVIFNKVKKYAIVLKDIKILLNPQEVQKILEISFSNREKLDIAAAINNKLDSYVHYYHNFAESVYQYPILHWNKTDLMVAYNDGDPDQGVPTEDQYVVFKMFWPNVTEFTVYNVSEMNPKPSRVTDPAKKTSGATFDDPKDGVLPVGTAVADIPVGNGYPGEPSVIFMIVQWYFRRGVSAKIDALLDALRDGSNVQDPSAESPFVYVPITQQIRFVEVIGMVDKCDLDIVINPPIKINWEEPTQAQTILYKGTWDYNDTTIAGKLFKVNSPGLEVLYFWHEVFTPDDLNDVDQKTFKYMVLGYRAPPEDTAGSASLSGPHFFPISQPMLLMDLYDARTRRSMPFALYNDSTGNVYEEIDGFKRIYGLMNFAFGVYDDVQAVPKQPIAGGFSAPWEIHPTGANYYWVLKYFYPSINQLYERIVWAIKYDKQGQFMEQKVFRYPNTNYSATGLINIAGPKANQVTRYFNDFAFAIFREGVIDNYYTLIKDGTVVGVTPTSDIAADSLDIFPLTTWNVALDKGVTEDYFVVTITRDVNGTLGYNIWGWNARDSFWGAIWASYYLGHFGGWLPEGVVALIVHITYTSDYREPVSFEIEYALGTITEFKLEYELAFGKGKGIPPLPPSPPLPDLDTLDAVNAGTYDWKDVGIPPYIGVYTYPGGDVPVFKKVIGWPWWGEKLPTFDVTRVHCDP